MVIADRAEPAGIARPLATARLAASGPAVAKGPARHVADAGRAKALSLGPAAWAAIERIVRLAAPLRHGLIGPTSAPFTNEPPGGLTPEAFDLVSR